MMTSRARPPLNGVLQPWTELEGIGGDELIQSAAKWHQVADGHGVTMWVEVRAAGAGLTLHFETALDIDPTMFATMASIVSFR
jgi:hypothetical protein